MKKEFFIFTLIWGLGLSVFAQDSTEFIFAKPEIRNRFETRDGFQKLASPESRPSIFMSQRTRLTLGYETSKLKIVFSPQDVRIWGDGQNANTAGFTGDNASLDLFEGYAEFNIGAKNRLSVGRQTLSYDNNWLLSDRNWNQNGISSDALVMKLQFGKTKVHAGGSWNTLKELPNDNFYPTTRYKSLNFLWVNRTFEKSKLSALHISTGQTKSDSSNTLYFRHTGGFFGSTEVNKLHLSGNAYYQYGKSQSGKNVGAFLLFADVAYKMSRLNVGTSVSYLSGNSTVGSAQKTDANFDLIYAARHKLLGFMDYFTNMALHTKQGGLTNYALNISFNASKKLIFQNNTHLFFLSQINANTPDEKYLGTENDFTVRYKFSHWGSLDAGYLLFNPTNALRSVQNVPKGRFSQYAYVQLLINPVIRKK